MAEANEAEVLAAEPESTPKPVLYQDPENQETWTPDWRISDLATADWALSRVGDLQREIDENEALAEAARDRITLKTQILNERVHRGVEFFKRHLEAFAQSHRELLLGGGKKKSRSMLHGSLGFRKAGGGLEVQDREALLDWARLQPIESGVLRITEEPNLVEIKREFKRMGELPPGTDLAPETEEVVIKAESGGSDGTH